MCGDSEGDQDRLACNGPKLRLENNEMEASHLKTQRRALIRGQRFGRKGGTCELFTYHRIDYGIKLC